MGAIGIGEEEDEQISGDEIAECEEQFAEGEEAGSGQEEPGEEGGVAVGFAGVGGLGVGDEAGGVGEDIVVYVGVFEGGVGILVETPEEEDEAEESSEGEDGEGGGEEGSCE